MEGDLKGPEIDVKAPKMDVNVGDIDIEGPEGKLKGPISAMVCHTTKRCSTSVPFYCCIILNPHFVLNSASLFFITFDCSGRSFPGLKYI